MNKPHPAVGDVVHYWQADPPPLSGTYVAPPCLHALLVDLTEPDEHYMQFATLAIVTDDGLLVKTNVPRYESKAYILLESGRQSEPNFGVPASWHSWEHDPAVPPQTSAA